MELSAIHHAIEYARERRRGQIPRVLVSLTRLSEKYLQLPIEKDNVRMSDWTRPLTPAQISCMISNLNLLYTGALILSLDIDAATDAYAGLRIFDALQKARVVVDPIPTLPACVKCGDDKKKRGVVTPKLYIDGVEAGSNSVSTWDTSFEATTQKNETAVVMDWAQEVEESRRGNEAAPVAKVRGPGKEGTNTNMANIHGENGCFSTKRPGNPPLQLSPEVEFATDWSKKHRARLTVGDAGVAQLKAYALWHWKASTPEDTAGHLEITVKTAAQYISQAIWVYQLDKDNLPSSFLCVECCTEVPT